MKVFYFTLVACLISIIVTVFQTTFYIQEYAYERIHNALNNATHDAALQIKPEVLAEGFIEFDQDLANEVFIETLKRNLPVDDSLKTINKTLLTRDIEIIETVFIDEMYRDPITNRPLDFPRNYHYKNDETGVEFNQPIFGPSVVYVIETAVYRESEPQRFLKIHEHKPIIIN